MSDEDKNELRLLLSFRRQILGNETGECDKEAEEHGWRFCKRCGTYEEHDDDKCKRCGAPLYKYSARGKGNVR